GATSGSETWWRARSWCATARPSGASVPCRPRPTSPSRPARRTCPTTNSACSTSSWPAPASSTRRCRRGSRPSSRSASRSTSRARTYRVDPRVIEYLERVVSAGHNALYRTRGRRRAPLFRYLVRDFPAAVVQSWGYVLAAFLLFAVPGAIGYAIIRAHPEQAEELLPPVMVSRAEQAAER